MQHEQEKLKKEVRNWTICFRGISILQGYILWPRTEKNLSPTLENFRNSSLFFCGLLWRPILNRKTKQGYFPSFLLQLPTFQPFSFLFSPLSYDLPFFPFFPFFPFPSFFSLNSSLFFKFLPEYTIYPWHLTKYLSDFKDFRMKYFQNGTEFLPSMILHPPIISYEKTRTCEEKKVILLFTYDEL